MFVENCRGYRLASHAGEVAQGLGWKMPIGKIVIEDAHLQRGKMSIFVGFLDLKWVKSQAKFVRLWPHPSARQSVGGSTADPGVERLAILAAFGIPVNFDGF